MKFSKIKLISISFSIILLFVLNGCSNDLLYDENKVYSEKELSRHYKSNDNIDISNNITRQEAINKSKEIIKKIFDFDVDKNKLNESVRILKAFDGKNDSELVWSIIWSGKKDGEINNKYLIEIGTNTGNLIKIHNLDAEYNINKYGLNLSSSKEELRNALSSLTEFVEIDLDNINIVYYRYGGIQILNTKTNDKFYLEMSNNKLVQYSKY